MVAALLDQVGLTRGRSGAIMTPTKLEGGIELNVYNNSIAFGICYSSNDTVGTLPVHPHLLAFWLFILAICDSWPP